MTLIELLTDHFTRAVSLPPLVNALSELDKKLDLLPKQSPYENLLVEEIPSPPVLARLMAALIRRHGERRALEERERPGIDRALEYLSRAKRPNATVAKMAEALLLNWHTSTTLDPLFDDAQEDITRFIELLKTCRTDPVALAQIAIISRRVRRSSPLRRGRKLSAASASHEFLLWAFQSNNDRRSYTWDPVREQYSDIATQATQKEFSLPAFDPRPASRRNKSGHKIRGKFHRISALA